MMVGFIPSILPLSPLYPIEPPFPISPRPKSLRKEADPKKVKFDEAGVLQDAPSSELCGFITAIYSNLPKDIGKMMKNGAMINFSILWGFDLDIFATQPRATTVTSYNLSTYDWNSRDLWKGKGYICVRLFSSKMAKLTSESSATLFCDVRWPYFRAFPCPLDFAEKRAPGRRIRPGRTHWVIWCCCRAASKKPNMAAVMLGSSSGSVSGDILMRVDLQFFGELT